MYRRDSRLGFVVAVGIMASGIAAKADTMLNYTLTDGSNVISFTLPQNNPTNTGPVEFSFENVSVTVNGVTAPEVVEFFIVQPNIGGLGGLAIFPSFGSPNAPDVIYQKGPELYTGTPENPTLSTFTNLGLTSIGGQLTGNFTLNATIAAPEPSSAVFFVLGGLFMTALSYKARKARA